MKLRLRPKYETPDRACPWCRHAVKRHDSRPVGCRAPGCICTHGADDPNFREESPAFALAAGEGR